MAKVEVQIRSCFCCGLSLATVLIALYTLLVYSLLTGLASWGLSDTNANGDSSLYTSCELEALGKIRPDNRKLTFHEGRTTVVIEDSSSYHCSFGLYTEELIFPYTWRKFTLIIDIILYVLIIIASIILLIGLATYVEWLLLPWIFLMILDIIRGLITVFFIFFYAHYNLVRIATGIFFLGLQFFHISLIMIMIAKFQRMHNRNTGNIIDGDRQYDARTGYPTLPSNYAYSPQMRRDQQYYPDQPDPRAYDTMYRQQLDHQQPSQQRNYSERPDGWCCEPLSEVLMQGCFAPPVDCAALTVRADQVFSFNDLGKELSVLVDRMIHRLITDEFLDGFSDYQLTAIIDAVYDILQPLGCLIEVTAPVVIFGDIHGQFGDLMRYLRIVGAPPEQNLLFLGDYVDRCKKGLEVIMLLFCFKVKYPDRINLLRGNHECTKMNRTYGFYQECKRLRTTSLWRTFQKAFNELPLCAKVSNRLICMHGGISPLIHGWHSLKNLKKPRNQSDCDMGLALDLMWSDPDNDPCSKGFIPNRVRNASWMFGHDTIKECTKALDVDMIVRAHEVVKDGHLLDCGEQICTIFSAPNYCGTDGNCGSVMRVSKDLKISFVTLKPKLDLQKLDVEKLNELEKQNKSNAVKSPNPGTNLLPAAAVAAGGAEKKEEI